MTIAAAYLILGVVIVLTLATVAAVLHYELIVQPRRRRYLQRTVRPAQTRQAFDPEQTRTYGGIR